MSSAFVTPKLTATPTEATLAPLFLQHIDALCAQYAEVMQGHGLDAVVLHSGSAQKRSVFDDQYWPLVVVPHTRHFLPLAVADCAVVVRVGQRPQLLLNTERGFWDGVSPVESAHFWQAFTIVEFDGPDRMRTAMPTGKTAFVGEDHQRAASWGFAPDAIAPAALLLDLDALRVKKSAYERLCLAEANRRACLGHDAVLRAFHDGSYSELELHLLYLQATAQDDPETPYKNIVALGEHAATLHHVHYGKTKVQAQSLLLDAGATFCGYDSDITRTTVKGSSAAVDVFSTLARGIDRLQLELCNRAKPGVPYENLHNQAHELVAELLCEVKLYRGPADAAVATDITRAFLPHGLGHSLGIQTHDVGCRNINPAPRNPFLRNTSTIAPGQVFTIEPGFYIIDSLLAPLRENEAGKAIDWNLVDALRPLGGIRVEDDLVVTETGTDNLTRTYLPG